MTISKLIFAIVLAVLAFVAAKAQSPVPNVTVVPDAMVGSPVVICIERPQTILDAPSPRRINVLIARFGFATPVDPVSYLFVIRRSTSPIDLADAAAIAIQYSLNKYPMRIEGALNTSIRDYAPNSTHLPNWTLRDVLNLYLYPRHQDHRTLAGEILQKIVDDKVHRPCNNWR